MSDVPKVHTAQPLVPLSDDEIADRAELPSWTMTEALFWLGGYRSPGYESARDMQDHSWNAYTQARLAVRQGRLCQKTVEAGETIFFDRPVRWLAWADGIGPKYIKVDERVRRALSQTADNPDKAGAESKNTAQGPKPLSEIQRDLKDRAQAVLDEGHIIQDQNDWRLSTRTIASIMINGADGQKFKGWGDETLRAILDGRHIPSDRLGLKRLVKK